MNPTPEEDTSDRRRKAHAEAQRKFQVAKKRKIQALEDQVGRVNGKLSLLASQLVTLKERVTAADIRKSLDAMIEMIHSDSDVLVAPPMDLGGGSSSTFQHTLPSLTTPSPTLDTSMEDPNPVISEGQTLWRELKLAQLGRTAYFSALTYTRLACLDKCKRTTKHVNANDWHIYFEEIEPKKSIDSSYRSSFVLLQKYLPSEFDPWNIIELERTFAIGDEMKKSYTLMTKTSPDSYVVDDSVSEFDVADGVDLMRPVVQKVDTYGQSSEPPRPLFDDYLYVEPHSAMLAYRTQKSITLPMARQIMSDEEFAKYFREINEDDEGRELVPVSSLSLRLVKSNDGVMWHQSDMIALSGCFILSLPGGGSFYSLIIQRPVGMLLETVEKFGVWKEYDSQATFNDEVKKLLLCMSMRRTSLHAKCGGMM